MQEIIKFINPIITPIFDSFIFKSGFIILFILLGLRQWKKDPWRVLEKYYKSSFTKVPNNFVQINYGYIYHSAVLKRSPAIVCIRNGNLYIRIPWPICYIRPCLLIPWDDMTITEERKLFRKSYVIHINKDPNIILRFSKKFQLILEMRTEQTNALDRAGACSV